MEYFKNLETIDNIQKDLRMLILTENHGKDMRGVEEIFRGRKPIYFLKHKLAKSHEIEYWIILYIVLTKKQIDMYQRN